MFYVFPRYSSPRIMKRALNRARAIRMARTVCSANLLVEICTQRLGLGGDIIGMARNAYECNKFDPMAFCWIDGGPHTHASMLTMTSPQTCTHICTHTRRYTRTLCQRTLGLLTTDAVECIPIVRASTWLRKRQTSRPQKGRPCATVYHFLNGIQWIQMLFYQKKQHAVGR